MTDSRNATPATAQLPRLPAIPPLDPALRQAAQSLIDNKTKPLGALGRLEDLAVRLCVMQGSLKPVTAGKLMLVFAGDHGLVEEGVSAFPQEVTVQMLHNFSAGGAAINVLCRQFNIDLQVVDAGVKGDVSSLAGIIGRKVRAGTRNAAKEAAMSADECRQALEAGMAVFKELAVRQPVQLLGLGEMGIGNTSSAALLIAGLTGSPLDGLVGRGTGLYDSQLDHKTAVLRRVMDFHQLAGRDPFDILCRVGGFEIAGMAGAAIAAAAARVPVVLDGVISTAAGLVAAALLPAVRDYMIIGHRSVEGAQARAAASLRIEPLLDLGMRLGEGTGAALAMSLWETAGRIVNQMASFADAGVSERL